MSVGKNSFRPDRRDTNICRFVGLFVNHPVPDVIEGIRAFHMDDFQISKCGTALRTVVDHIIVAVNQAVVEHFDKHAVYCFDDVVIKRKCVS